MEVQLVSDISFSLKAIFTHPTDDYDFVLHLDGVVLPRYFHNIAVDTKILSQRGKYANITREDQDATVRPGFDPARLLFKDLQVRMIVACCVNGFLGCLPYPQRIYAHTFKIFHDSLGGDRFGVVWDPSLKEPRPFRVLGQFSSIPIKKVRPSL